MIGGGRVGNKASQGQGQEEANPLPDPPYYRTSLFSTVPWYVLLSIVGGMYVVRMYVPHTYVRTNNNFCMWLELKFQIR